MKKIILQTLLVLMVASLVVSCTSTTESAAEETTEVKEMEVDLIVESEAEADEVKEQADSEESIVVEEEKATEESTIKEIELEASNWDFTVVSADEIYEGDTVKMTVTGVSGSHGLRFEEIDASISSIRKGDVETVEFVAPEAGEYRYFCSVSCGSGHSTMDGILTVLAKE